MANLLAHALFALALFAVPSSSLHGVPLSEYGFYAALASLMPDLEGISERARTPMGHSIAFGFLWALLVLFALGLAGWVGLVPAPDIPILVGACLTGLLSHLLLDALREPGIFTWPRADGRWSRFAVFPGHHTSGLNYLVSGLSIGAILTMLILY